MLLTERPGRLRLVDRDGKLDPRPIAGVPAVAVVGQGGLLDVALHPAFETKPLGLYFLRRAGRGRLRHRSGARAA